MFEEINDIQHVNPTDFILKIPFVILVSRIGLNMTHKYTSAVLNVCYLIIIFPNVKFSLC